MKTDPPAASGPVTYELHVLADAFGDPRWAQGPGGNVSVKHDDRLFIKASGTKLVDVPQPPNHVGVSLADARLALEGDAAADARVFACTPRPSLETYFHALDGAVVAHTHPVGVLLVACSAEDTGVTFDARVPYERPGRGLAVSIARHLAAVKERRAPSATNVLLESHGLVVYAESGATAVGESLALVEECLATKKADLASFDALVAAYKSAPLAIEGGVAFKLPRRTSSERYLFPDAVVYASTVRVEKVDEGVAAKAIAELARAVVLVANDGARIAVAKTPVSLEACVEILAAHDWVEDTLGAGARYLADDEPAKILGLPSEQHRIRLANA